jgi:hypothetical protein
MTKFIILYPSDIKLTRKVFEFPSIYVYLFEEYFILKSIDYMEKFDKKGKYSITVF